MKNKEVVIRAENISMEYPIIGGIISRPVAHLSAVKDLSLEVYRGEILGLVGESGCGKTTLSSILLGIQKPTSGSIFFHGKDISKIRGRELRNMRKNMQMIYQDPYSSLSPRMTVEELIAEPLLVQKICNKKEAYRRVQHLLDVVGLDSSDAKRYASDFSGGQRQRIGIARALVLKPDFVVCDEPVSALDVSIHAQIINLLMMLQRELNLTYIFISHNLGAVRHVSTRTAVMYLGTIAEIAETESIFETPLHPYTKALLSAIPQLNPDSESEQIILTGDVPSPINPPSGCRFRTRCPNCLNKCIQLTPELKEVSPGHQVACHLY